MTLWLRTVLGSHLRCEYAPLNFDGQKIKAEVSEKLKAIGIPKPVCDVNRDREGGIGVAIGARMGDIDILHDIDNRHAALPYLTDEQRSLIRVIAVNLAASLRENGYTDEIKLTDGIAVHATR
jgi:hypothetical protein